MTLHHAAAIWFWKGLPSVGSSGITSGTMSVPSDLADRPIRFDDPHAPEPLTTYLRAMARVCPFIEPAEKAGCLYTCPTRLDCRSADQIHPRMFEHLVPAIERFRDQRRALPDKNHRLLLSYTLVFELPAALDADANRLLSWPNWLAVLVKHLYTPKGVIFGFIRKGVSERSSAGDPIPIAPFHAVVIRSQVVGADHRFFAGNEAWLSALFEAVDDGADVHAGLLPKVPDLRNPAALRANDYFDRLRTWGQSRFRR